MAHNVATEIAQELAFDEALLLHADELTERTMGVNEFIRVWEFVAPVVVLGRSSKVAEEVDIAYCRSEAIPIHRRSSGGASVVGGPGCLMYSVVLDLNLRPELSQIDKAHQFVMQRVLSAVNVQLGRAEFQGTCDLTLDNRKFSGNSMRVARHHLLYHGTLLYQADLARIANCLRLAPRQPGYRAERPHTEFITNVVIDPEQFRGDLLAEFGVTSKWSGSISNAMLMKLKSERYDNPNWNYSR